MMSHLYVPQNVVGANQGRPGFFGGGSWLQETPHTLNRAFGKRANKCAAAMDDTRKKYWRI